MIEKKHGGDVACYVINYLSCDILSASPSRVENTVFKVLQPNAKVIIVETFIVPGSN